MKFRPQPSPLALLFTCVAAALLQACAASSSDDAALVGGVTGAAVGAGTGALIGSAMSNGSVGKSALVGGAIGIPAGIVVGVAVHEIGQARERNSLDSAVERNSNRIRQNQEEIEEIRSDVIEEQGTIRVDDSRAGYAYDGPTIGNPRR